MTRPDWPLSRVRYPLPTRGHGV